MEYIKQLYVLPTLVECHYVALKSIISCDVLGLEENFQGICFGHAFSKAC